MNPAVVLVTGDFVPTGGMDRANYALASYLAREVCPVRLVAHRVDSNLAAIPGVSVIPVPKPLNSDFLGARGLNRAGQRAAREPGTRVLSNGGNCLVPDANWVHYLHAAYRPTVRGSLARRFKFAIERRRNRRHEQTALARARVIIANSQRTRHDIIEHIKVREELVHVVYYGIDADLFRPASAAERGLLREQLGWPALRPVVLFIGALGDRRKGFDTLFTAWSKLAKRSDWDAILGVIGEGAERPTWERRARDSGLEDTIRFLGFRRDVPDLLRAADALVAPTRYEAYGLGVHEALCCGLPTIVSAEAGVAERFPPELHELRLPDAEEATDLANRLDQWHASRVVWAERVAPFGVELRSWSWDDMARAIWERIA